MHFSSCLESSRFRFSKVILQSRIPFKSWPPLRSGGFGIFNADFELARHAMDLCHN